MEIKQIEQIFNEKIEAYDNIFVRAIALPRKDCTLVFKKNSEPLNLMGDSILLIHCGMQNIATIPFNTICDIQEPSELPQSYIPRDYTIFLKNRYALVSDDLNSVPSENSIEWKVKLIEEIEGRNILYPHVKM